jgi:hypothetical protein
MMPRNEDAPLGAGLGKSKYSCIYNKHISYKEVSSDAGGLSSPKPSCEPGFWSLPQKIVVARRMLVRGVSRRLIEPVLGMPASTLIDLAADLGVEVSDRKVRIGSGEHRPPPVPAASDDPSPAPEPPSARAPLMTLRDFKALVSAWVYGTDIGTLATELERTIPALKRKARSLGLMGRQREDLVKEFHAAAPHVEPDGEAPAKSSRKIYPWSPPATRSLCDLWVNGTRPGDIAKILGASPSAVSTRAFRLGLPARVRSPDGAYTLPKRGHVLFDPEHQEHFWSPRSTATQSAWRTMRAG